jgi:hypothetical protein
MDLPELLQKYGYVAVLVGTKNYSRAFRACVPPSSARARCWAIVVGGAGYLFGGARTGCSSTPSATSTLRSR